MSKIASMSESEARRTIEAIAHHLTSARALLLDLHHREGWAVLGYTSMRECLLAEFPETSYSYLVRQLNAAIVETSVLPMGNIGSIPERQLRPLAPFKNEPEQVKELWQKAEETAPNGRLTASHVEKVVQQYKTVAAEMPATAMKIDIAVEPDPKSAPEPTPATNKMAVHHSSKSNEHYTPKAILEAVVECLGGIDLDPCSNSHCSPNVPATHHFTQEDNGLAQVWKGRVFMNPPYGNEVGPWVEKLVSEHEAGNVTAAISLVASRTDTQWFKRLRDYPCCFVEGRLKFVGSKDAAPFPSAIFYLGEDIAAFHFCFSEIGDIWQRIEPEMFAA